MGRGCSVQADVVGEDFAIRGDTYLRPSISVHPAIAANVEGAPFVGADGRILGISVFPPASGAEDVSVLLPGAIASLVTSEMLRSGASPVHPFGIVSGDLSPVLARRLGAGRERGAVIMMVAPHSPADRAGLVVGDTVVGPINLPYRAVLN